MIAAPSVLCVMQFRHAWALCTVACLALCVPGAEAFVAPPRAVVPRVAPRAAPARITMMGNPAPEGPFTPIVLFSKDLIGEKRFNKIRGKLITYHSQVIGYFCSYTGTPRKMNQLLIKKAKQTGGRLGFLN